MDRCSCTQVSGGSKDLSTKINPKQKGKDQRLFQQKNNVPRTFCTTKVKLLVKSFRIASFGVC